MCDPVSIGYGLMAVATVHSAEQGRKSASQARQLQTDMVNAEVAERANAEAKAAQSAQSRLATDQRRRRQAGGLLSQGAPSMDSTMSSTGTATIQPVTSGTAGKQQSMLSRGSSATFYGG